MHLSLLVTAAAVLAMAAGVLKMEVAAQFGGKIIQVELWCVAKNNAEDSALQSAVDWACGPGGADCAWIQQGGPCYDPSDVQLMASYVFNNYYLKNGLADDACSFSNNAAVTSLNPSQGTCKIPSSKRVSGGSVSDATATQGATESGYSDMSGARPIFSGYTLPFIVLGHIVIMARLIHHL